MKWCDEEKSRIRVATCQWPDIPVVLQLGVTCDCYIKTVLADSAAQVKVWCQYMADLIRFQDFFFFSMCITNHGLVNLMSRGPWCWCREKGKKNTRQQVKPRLKSDELALGVGSNN